MVGFGEGHGSLNTFSGIRIIEDFNCLKDTDEPVKIHQYKPWMSTNYHNRVQKKWIKRWGYIKEPAMYQTGNNTVVAHPAMVQELKREMQRQNNVIKK